MSKHLKQKMRNEYESSFASLKDCIFVDLTNIPSDKTLELRSALHKEKIRCTMVKNRLARVAFPELNDAQAKEVFKGPTAVMHGGEDIVALAKTVIEWRKANKMMEFKGALVDGQVIPAKKVQELNKLAGKQELRGKIVSCIAGPLTGLLAVVNGLPRGLARVIQQHGEKKGG